MTFASSLELSLTLVVMVVAASALAMSGFIVAHINIAPQFASFLMGTSKGAGTLSGIASPYVTRLLVEGRESSIEGWQLVFRLAAGCI